MSPLKHLDGADPAAGAFKCAKCGSATRVIDSRPNGDAVIRRRRVCLLKSCRERTTTYEIPLPDGFTLDHLMAAASLARDLTRLEQAIQRAVTDFNGTMQNVRRQLADARLPVL